MKNLSYWSKRNPIKARMIIGLFHILLIILGIMIGIRAYLDDIHISSGSLFLMVNVFFIAYMLYPKRGHKQGIFTYSYGRRVRHDFLLVLSSTWVLASGINNFAFQPSQNKLPQPQVSLMVAKMDAIDDMTSKKEFKFGVLKRIKEYRTAIKQQLKSMKADHQAKDDSKIVLKVLLITLILLGAIFSIGMIGALSCSISCSGNEGLAIVVFIGGAAAVVWLSVFLISKILKIGKNTHPAGKKGQEKAISHRA